MEVKLGFHDARNLGNVSVIAEALEFEIGGNFYPQDEAYLGAARKQREVAGLMRQLADKIDEQASRLEGHAYREPPTPEEKVAMVGRFFGQLMNDEK